MTDHDSMHYCKVISMTDHVSIYGQAMMPACLWFCLDFYSMLNTVKLCYCLPSCVLGSGGFAVVRLHCQAGHLIKSEQGNKVGVLRKVCQPSYLKNSYYRVVALHCYISVYFDS